MVHSYRQQAALKNATQAGQPDILESETNQAVKSTSEEELPQLTGGKESDERNNKNARVVEELKTKRQELNARERNLDKAEQSRVSLTLQEKEQESFKLLTAFCRNTVGRIVSYLENLLELICEEYRN